MREFDASSPCEFESGRMVWARVGGAPFWPSVIVADPDLLLSTRVAAKGSSLSREYHVQFFGKAVQRAWVASSALLPFSGLAAFLEKAREVKDEVGKAKTKQKLLKAYNPSGSHRRAWDDAVQEAEDSFKYSDGETRATHMKKLLERSLTARKRKLAHDGDSPEGQGREQASQCCREQMHLLGHSCSVTLSFDTMLHTSHLTHLITVPLKEMND